MVTDARLRAALEGETADAGVLIVAQRVILADFTCVSQTPLASVPMGGSRVAHS